MKILWAVRNNAPEWAEEIITTNDAVIPDAMKWATANGFGHFRISEVDDNPEKPDFINTITNKEGLQ